MLNVPTAHPVNIGGPIDRELFSRPPIVEALIDIQVAFNVEPNLERLKEAGSQFETRFPTRESLQSFTLTADGKAGTVSTEQHVVGFRYWSEARDQVIQLRRDGMMFSRIPTEQHRYDKWETSLSETQAVWNAYCESLRPSRVSRLAVRYINRINLPQTAARLDDYFNARPELPRSIPLSPRSFIMRLEVPLPSVENGVLILTHGTLPPEHADALPVLLDLDVSRPVSIPCGDGAKEMWKMLQELHDQEWILFRSFVTDQATELFR